MLSHITAWTQGRPLLPALRNSARFLTIPLTHKILYYIVFLYICNKFTSHRDVGKNKRGAPERTVQPWKKKKSGHGAIFCLIKGNGLVQDPGSGTGWFSLGILVKWYTLIYANEWKQRWKINNKCEHKTAWSMSGISRLQMNAFFHQDILQSRLKIKIWHRVIGLVGSGYWKKMPACP